jgi:hypothetical protein
VACFPHTGMIVIKKKEKSLDDCVGKVIQGKVEEF